MEYLSNFIKKILYDEKMEKYGKEGEILKNFDKIRRENLKECVVFKDAESLSEESDIVGCVGIDLNKIFKLLRNNNFILKSKSNNSGIYDVLINDESRGSIHFKVERGENFKSRNYWVAILKQGVISSIGYFEVCLLIFLAR